MDGSGLGKLMMRHIPEQFLRRITEAAFLARREAWSACKSDFADPEAENLRPFYVRAKLEGYLRAAADRTPGVDSRVVKEPRQPWNHTEVFAGPVVMTAATVPSPLAPVDPADYREGLARSNQLYFETLRDAPPTDATLYVLLLHSRWLAADFDVYGFLPGSVHLAFPDSEMKGYLHDINLLRRYPDVVRKYVPRDWDSADIVRYVDRSRKTA